MQAVASESRVPRALAPHLVFAGAGLEETQAAINRTFCPTTLRPIPRGARLAARQHAACIGSITLSYIHFGAELEIVAGEVERFFGVQVPLQGRAEVRSGEDAMVASRAIASVPGPIEPLRMRWAEGAAKLVVKVDRAVLERHLARLLGHAPREPLRPVLGMRLAAPEGARWRAILELLLAEVEHGGRGPRPGVSAAAVEEVVLNWLTLGHPNNYWDRLRLAEAQPGPVHVRRAVEYAREHLHEPLTVGALAEAAGVSERTLHAGFRRSLGCSPAAYVRDLRLDRVRDELRRAEPGDGTRVTDVALRWGFSHFGRFAALYRRRFGERPSETLRA